MGIRGLNTFFNQNPEFWKPHKLHDTHVIIDGNNLIHALYFSYKVNFMYGGDYKKYADTLRRYLTAYTECNVKPIIIFDGGCDRSDRKLNTIIERSKDRLSQTLYISKHGCCSGKVLPILANDVFRATLSELNITFAQCSYEADDEITVLANYFNCPVISADSDFYIFDVHQGFIHLEYIDTTINVELNSDGKEYKFLNCKIYHIDKFVEYFSGINKKLLPLFGTLLGNDFVKGNEFDSFFSNIKLPKYRGKKLIINPRQQKMIGLLCWLKHDTISEAIEQVLVHIKKEKRENIKIIIENAIESYNLYHSDLINVINKQDTELLNNQLITPCGSSLPVNIVLKLYKGELSSLFINVIALHRVFLQPQVENTDLPSSYSCSVFIRQIMYGILIQHDKCNNSKCLSSICEYDRENKNLRKVHIEPIFSLKTYGNLPKLNELSFLKEESSKIILSEVLAINCNLFTNFPKNWQLFIASIMYWLHNCAGSTPKAFFYSLLLNFLYFNIIKCKNLIGKKCNDTCICVSIICILANITELELQNASEKLKKYEQQPSFNNGNPLIISFVHSYSQFQTCILFIMYLNQLLGNFIEAPTLSKCLGGTFLYNMAKDISSRQYPDLFISELLGRETMLLKLFNSLKDVIYQNVPNCSHLKDTVSKTKKKKIKNSCLINKCTIFILILLHMFLQESIKFS